MRNDKQILDNAFYHVRVSLKKKETMSTDTAPTMKSLSDRM
jgi:hypothetical protein